MPIAFAMIAAGIGFHDARIRSLTVLGCTARSRDGTFLRPSSNRSNPVGSLDLDQAENPERAEVSLARQVSRHVTGTAMSTLGRTLLAILVALTSLSAISKQVREQGVTDTEIRIGNLMPYSGNLEVFGAIGKAEAAYFEMINERGGINGREVRFISYDDKSNPMAALDLTRTLIEKDNVLLLFRNSGQLCRTQILE